MRLVVSQKYRRHRIGSRLLIQLEQHAVERGYEEVRMYTNNLNTTHIKFIRQHGYDMVNLVTRGLMRGDLIQWKKCLSLENGDVQTRRNSVVLNKTFFMD
eukprot:Trichotokara_eunicae@DN3621_c0_g1_i4.p1